jgi:uncharacterized membrane protein HdeD (DUF308 family)
MFERQIEQRRKIMQIIFPRSRVSLLLRGGVAILFGLLALFWPFHTILALVLLFGAYIMLDGFYTIVGAVMERQNQRWWISLLKGVVDIAIGIVTFLWPAITVLVLLYLIAIWAFSTGIFEICLAVLVYRSIRTGWLLTLVGVLAVIFGLLLIVHPAAGALAVVALFGTYAIVYGVFLLAFSFGHGKSELTPA